MFTINKEEKVEVLHLWVKLDEVTLLDGGQGDVLLTRWPYSVFKRVNMGLVLVGAPCHIKNQPVDPDHG